MDESKEKKEITKEVLMKKMSERIASMHKNKAEENKQTKGKAQQDFYQYMKLGQINTIVNE